MEPYRLYLFSRAIGAVYVEQGFQRGVAGFWFLDRSFVRRFVTAAEIEETLAAHQVPAAKERHVAALAG